MSPDWWRDCRDGIEKCSSPTGDGNMIAAIEKKSTTSLRNVVPRQGTETICTMTVIDTPYIEKCSSPTGDGNQESVFPRNVLPALLRNVVPRQGTETCRPHIALLIFRTIEKCSSPTGDGNYSTTAPP